MAVQNRLKNLKVFRQNEFNTKILQAIDFAGSRTSRKSYATRPGLGPEIFRPLLVQFDKALRTGGMPTGRRSYNIFWQRSKADFFHTEKLSQAGIFCNAVPS